MARPHWYDGTALVVGAAAPDLAYPFGAFLSRQSHTLIGFLVWSIPLTVAICVVLRWRAAAGIFAHLPDAGRLRLRSFRVLGARRPAALITLWSAAIGAGSHILIDAFTHSRRWGARLVGFDRVFGEWPLRGEPSIAAFLQYAGHTAGTAVGILLFVLIAQRGLLEQWYGDELVARVRSVEIGRRERIVFWSIAAAVVVVPTIVAAVNGRGLVFVVVAMVVLGLLIAGAATGENLNAGTPEHRSGRVPASTDLNRRASSTDARRTSI